MEPKSYCDFACTFRRSDSRAEASVFVAPIPLDPSAAAALRVRSNATISGLVTRTEHAHGTTVRGN